MYYPSLEEFKKLSKKGNVIPVYRELFADLETPVSAFMKINTSKYSYLLESVEGGEKIGRYSFLGNNPSLIIRSKAQNVEILKKSDKGFVTTMIQNPEGPLAEIKKIIQEYKFVNIEGLPQFCGGLVGFMGYDTVRFYENIPDNNPDDLKLYDAVLMLTDTILIFDHVSHKIKIVSNVYIENSKRASLDKQLEAIYAQSIEKIDALAKTLQKPLKFPKQKISKQKFEVNSNTTKKEFKSAVEKAKEFIKAGDIIQTVLSQRFSVKVDVPNFDIYRSLRIINPSPFMFYLKLDNMKLIGSSPEILVRCEKGVAEVRPIAGTRKRGKTEQEDIDLADDLLHDPKEIAEHIMLVDLGRNDLGRVCKYGSVSVKEFMAIEKYSHVMHIVSDVQGILNKNKDAFDVLKATFPAGTLSGAPKVRAMEIIDQLETVRRGPYGGCIGYFGFSGNIDTCITIRTIVLKNKTAYIQAGAGIVADSVPGKEYQETVNKAQALIKAIEIAQGGLL